MKIMKVKKNVKNEEKNIAIVPQIQHRSPLLPLPSLRATSNILSETKPSTNIQNNINKDDDKNNNINNDCDNGQVWVSQYVDYIKKYGVGYALSNGMYGVYFNDTSKIILHCNNDITYIPSLQDNNAKNDDENDHKNNEIHETCSLTKYPAHLSKKNSSFETFLSIFKSKIQIQK